MVCQPEHLIYQCYQQNPDPKSKCNMEGKKDDEKEGDGRGKMGIEDDSG